MAQPEPAQLAAVGGDVGGGRDRRVLAGLHGVLLGRQPEGVEAHRVQHVAARHPLVAGVDVGAGVAERVADVEARAGRVREHVEHEQLLAARRRRRAGSASGPAGLGVSNVPVGVPPVLPPGLDLLGERGGVAMGGYVVAGAGLCVMAMRFEDIGPVAAVRLRSRVRTKAARQ